MLPGWLPDNLKKNTGQVQLQLLCGADLLESFATPGLWQDEDVVFEIYTRIFYFLHYFRFYF